MLILTFFLLITSTSLLRSNFFAAAYKITGAPGAPDPKSGSLPQRQEISGFARSGPAFDLFALALADFQSMNQTDQLSYFQVAGIHGLPAVPWDGVNGAGVLDSGYCMHGSVLFPVWHRPYLALFEQLIWRHAQQIAGTYPPDQVARYKNAALTLRIPYWDWAINPALPTSYTSPTIFINTPSGWREIKNPMYRYDFHPDSEGNVFPLGDHLSAARYTTRCADSQLIQSNDNEATRRMTSDAAGYASNYNNLLFANQDRRLSFTYQILSSVDDWTSFSCASCGSSDSIEAVHNQVHQNVGCDGNGSMFDPGFAAFDPIFWLHHAQVDRLTALWQALNPGTYVVPYNNGFGSYYQPKNTVDTINNALAPFHVDGSRMFTAQDVISTTDFGYTYPELNGLNDVAHNIDQQAILRTTINQLYNPRVNSAQNSKSVQMGRRTTSLSAAFNHVSLSFAQELGVNNLEIQWSIRIQMQLFGTSAPVTIYFFMGIPPPNMANWSRAPNLVGTFAPFRGTSPSSNSGSFEITDLTYGAVPLTHVLAAAISRGYISVLTPQEVVPILKKHLQWRASTAGDREIPLSHVPGLLVTIQSRNVKPTTSQSEFPTYGRHETHIEVTAGKVGGATANI